MPVWIVFFVSAALLVCGYFFYGAFVERVFGVDPNRKTPVQKFEDGRDYIEMPVWKVFLVQLLNIAGLGPIFGPLLGALYGPIAIVWIVVGCIFGGAVHDFMCGMLSMRHDGKSLPNICGEHGGRTVKLFMVVFCLISLILTGMVFVTGPAGVLATVTHPSATAWLYVIFGYYFLATILPVDKIIGKIYPVFGGLLVFMAVSLLIAMIFNPQFSTIPASYWTSCHPSGESAWPAVFITIACGALSGFHSTQSPLMARCLSNEKYGRLTFYGAMIGEGLIAMVWVLLGAAFHENGYANVYDWSNPAIVAHNLSTELLGKFGGVLAMLGVVALPITSGDTAFRSARLIVADAFNIDQKSDIKCLAIAVPLFATGFICNAIGFDKLWQYFGWSNQTLAAIALWIAALYLHKNGKNCLIALFPASFITVAITTFLFSNKLMPFHFPLSVSTVLGIIAAIWMAFEILHLKPNKTTTVETETAKGQPSA